MEELLDAIAALVVLVSPEKVQAVAVRIRRTEAGKVAAALSGVVNTPAAAGVVDQLINAWTGSDVSAAELASMLQAATHVFTKVASQQTTELVWTGPTTPFVSARRTEQALLQVINAANGTLFITSFVAYNVSIIVRALNAACDRKVLVYMLLELSEDQGGSINLDVIAKMKGLIPRAKYFAWHNKSDEFSGGRVHAKVAVADGAICFITSANLTGFAMEKNIEIGVLIRGGAIPRQLNDHLISMVGADLITPA